MEIISKPGNDLRLTEGNVAHNLTNFPGIQGIFPRRSAVGKDKINIGTALD